MNKKGHQWVTANDGSRHYVEITSEYLISMLLFLIGGCLWVLIPNKTVHSFLLIFLWYAIYQSSVYADKIDKTINKRNRKLNEIVIS